LARGFCRAEICSEHRKPSDWQLRAGQYPEIKPVAEGTGAGRDVVEKARETMADSREVMNIRQASQYLGVSPDTLYKYVGEQKIPAFKLGNRWRFKKSRLDQWMEEKSSEMEPLVKRKPKAAGKAAGAQ
jgi:excisionase family DNA binding protein